MYFLNTTGTSHKHLTIVLAVPKCVGPTRDLRFVLNMDQTNSKFGNLPSHTIDQRGARTINMHTGTDD
jgi:hypothetical protein